jgi:hypothetical protein
MEKIMKIRLTMMFNTTTAILFSVACNAVLFSYLLWSNIQSEIHIVSSDEHSIDNLESKSKFKKKYENQDAIDKFKFINATIEKNQKFNQELKNFISQSESSVLLGR